MIYPITLVVGGMFQPKTCEVIKHIYTWFNSTNDVWGKNKWPFSWADPYLKLFQLLAWLHERVLCRIRFLSTFLSGMDIGFFWPAFLILASIFHVVQSIHDPCFLQRLQCFSKQTFFRTLAIDSVPGLLFFGGGAGRGKTLLVENVTTTSLWQSHVPFWWHYATLHT